MIDDNKPRRVLCATSARIGGIGHDAVVYETLCGLKDRLGKADRIRSSGFDRTAREVREAQRAQ